MLQKVLMLGQTKNFLSALSDKQGSQLQKLIASAVQSKLINEEKAPLLSAVMVQVANSTSITNALDGIMTSEATLNGINMQKQLMDNRGVVLPSEDFICPHCSGVTNLGLYLDNE